MLLLQIALLVQEFITIKDIDQISSTLNSRLSASYIQDKPLQPKFTDVFSQYTLIFDGQNNTIRNLYLNTHPQHRAIFGLCNNATIQNLALENVKFTLTNDNTNQLSILCGTAVNTTFKNLRISINSLISNFNNSGLIATEMINCTLQNVTITGNIYVNISTNKIVSLLSSNMQNSTLKDFILQSNIQINAPNTNTYLITSISNSNLSFMEVKNNLIINNSILHGMLFSNAQNTQLNNVILYQNITQNNNTTKINLISENSSKLNMTQVQIIINNGRTPQQLALQQSDTSYNTTNCLTYTEERVPANIKFVQINNTTIKNAYNNFNKTELIQNTVDIYELELLYKNNYYVNEKSECGINECGDPKQCQTYHSLISNLIAVNYQKCICNSEKTGKYCENCVDTNKVMNLTTWECEYSNDYKCRKYGGYDYTLNKCRNCPLGYTGQFCKECIQNTSFVRVYQVTFNNQTYCNLSCINGVEGICQRCKEGYTGQFCDQCDFNYRLINNVKCEIDPIVQCAFHGGYNAVTNQCISCLAESSGPLCTDCINKTSHTYVEFKCRERHEHQCKHLSDFDYVRQKCKECPINTTGDLCDQCAPNYKNQSGICVPDENLICIENGGYNQTTNKCEKCQEGFFGQFCNYSYYECCSGASNCPNISYQSPECEKYLDVYCTNHGPLLANKSGCSWCQFGYVGSFCQNCNQTFVQINGSCVPDFKQGAIPRCIKHNNYQCLECMEGYYGYFCDQCILGYNMILGMCIPYNVTERYPCWNHGGTNITHPYLQCEHCYTGYQGNDCAICSASNYISFMGQCVYNYTTECQNNGGYDVVNNKCKQCSNGFSGNFCTQCDSDIVINGECTLINTQRSYFITGLIAIVVVLAIFLLILLILIIVFAVRCSQKQKHEQADRLAGKNNNTPIYDQNVYQSNTPDINSNRNNLVVADTPLYKNRISNQYMELSQTQSRQQGSHLVDSEEELMQLDDQPIVDLDSEALDNTKRLQFIVKPRKFNISTDIKNVTVSKHD